jgi:ferric-dicitrate binding protein FerR (iron transport regulator)
MLRVAMIAGAISPGKWREGTTDYKKGVGHTQELTLRGGKQVMLSFDNGVFG